MAERQVATNDQFISLMQSGRDAFARGNRQSAHELWREAAQINPYDEQVWLSLYEVLDSDEDRRVCLQNILQINQMNVQARRELNKLDARAERAVLLLVEEEETRRGERRRRFAVLLRAIAIGAIFGLSAVVFAILGSVLLYGR